MTRVVVVTGGKGGVGKTFVAVNVADLLAKERSLRVLLVDLDVSNPCTPSLLNLPVSRREPVTVFRPRIDRAECAQCGECVRRCPAHALVLIPGKGLMLIGTLCEGCAMCLYVCPRGAIREGEEVVGWVSVTEEVSGLRLVYGELVPGGRQEGEVAERTLESSRRFWEGYDYVVVDTPPGTGKVILRAVSVADLVLSVTEPTRLGLHDLAKLHSLVKRLGKREVVVVNKYGIPYGDYDELEGFLKAEGLASLRIPYSEGALRSYFEGKPVRLSGEPEVLERLRDVVRAVVSGHT